MIYLHHIPGACGTSLVYTFLAQAGDPVELCAQLRQNDGILYVKDTYKAYANRAVWLEENTYFGWSTKPVYETVLPQNTFSITVLRDPVNRLVSCYRAFLLTHEWKGKDFWDYINSLPNELLFRQITMFSQKCDIDEAHQKIGQLSYAFRSERYLLAIEQLSCVVHAPLKQFHITAQDAKNGDVVNPRVSHEANIYARRKLKERMEPEYELLRRLAATSSSTFSP